MLNTVVVKLAYVVCHRARMHFIESNSSLIYSIRFKANILTDKNNVIPSSGLGFELFDKIRIMRFVIHAAQCL